MAVAVVAAMLQRTALRTLIALTLACTAQGCGPDWGDPDWAEPSTGSAESFLGATMSIEPLRDGATVLPRIAELVHEATEYVHVGTWLLDEELRLSATSQSGQYTQRSRNRTSRFPPFENPDDLRCGSKVSQPAHPAGLHWGVPAWLANTYDPHSFITLLRCKAAHLALMAGSGVDNIGARGDIKVLVWDQHFKLDPDGPFGPEKQNLETLAYIMVPLHTVASWTDAVMLTEMRRRGSGESLRILRAFRDMYSNLSWAPRSYPGFEVPMPTGIAIMAQDNRYGISSSHHQKMLVTERGAYIGGRTSRHAIGTRAST